MIGSDMPSFNSSKTIESEYRSMFSNLDASKINEVCWNDDEEPWYFKTLDQEFRDKFKDEHSMLDQMEDTFPQN